MKANVKKVVFSALFPVCCIVALGSCAQVQPAPKHVNQKKNIDQAKTYLPQPFASALPKPFSASKDSTTK